MCPKTRPGVNKLGDSFSKKPPSSPTAVTPSHLHFHEFQRAAVGKKPGGLPSSASGISFTVNCQFRLV